MNKNLKEIWQMNAPEPADIKVLEGRIGDFKSKSRKTNSKIIVMMIGTLAIILTIAYFIPPQLLTTWIGLFLTCASLLFVGVFNLKGKEILDDQDFTINNKQYLDHLLNIKNRQKKLQGIVLGSYFLLLGAGICLYMYEYTLYFPKLIAIGVYIMLFAWIALNWFVLRPRVIKKQNGELDSIISRIKTIHKQHVE